MRMRWRIILPIIGLLLFALEAYDSNRDWQVQPLPRRYYWWSFIRLDANPLSRRPFPEPEQLRDGNGTTWHIRSKIVDPGYMADFIFLSGLPAFMASAVVLSALSRFGASQVWTFMISTPILLFAWYYFLGWLLDRWRRRSPRVTVNT